MRLPHLGIIAILTTHLRKWKKKKSMTCFHSINVNNTFSFKSAYDHISEIMSHNQRILAISEVKSLYCHVLKSIEELYSLMCWVNGNFQNRFNPIAILSSSLSSLLCLLFYDNNHSGRKWLIQHLNWSPIVIIQTLT